MFRKVKDALADINHIKYVVDKIQKNIECQYIRRGYRVIAFSANQSIYPVQVSFELNYHDWLQLENSDEWKAFVSLLLEHQDEYNLKRLQANQCSKEMEW